MSAAVIPLFIDVIEEWRPVMGYEGIYEISNLGRCRRLGASYHVKRAEDRLLKWGVNEDGYLIYSILDDGKRHGISMHRLVAQAFIPNPLGLPEVNHIDGNVQNNAIKNLEWVTRGENLLHAYRIGLKERPYGAKNGRFQSLIVAYRNGKQVEVFDGPTSMRKKGYGSRAVYACLNGKRKHHHGCTYRRITPHEVAK